MVEILLGRILEFLPTLAFSIVSRFLLVYMERTYLLAVSGGTTTTESNVSN